MQQFTGGARYQSNVRTQVEDKDNKNTSVFLLQDIKHSDVNN